MTIFKYSLPFNDEITINMPKGAKVLSVGQQENQPFVWALVDPARPSESRRFHWRGTGHPADGLGDFVGTVLVQGGAFVFHLFEART